jgi:hypothetical protein
VLARRFWFLLVVQIVVIVEIKIRLLGRTLGLLRRFIEVFIVTIFAVIAIGYAFFVFVFMLRG